MTAGLYRVHTLRQKSCKPGLVQPRGANSRLTTASWLKPSRSLFLTHSPPLCGHPGTQVTDVLPSSTRASQFSLRHRPSSFPRADTGECVGCSVSWARSREARITSTNILCHEAMATLACREMGTGCLCSPRGGGRGLGGRQMSYHSAGVSGTLRHP